MVRPVWLLAGFLLASQGTQACPILHEDPSGDTEPRVLPGYYDLVGVEVASDGENVTWSWLVASLEGLRGVLYHGQLQPDGVDPRDGSFHPACNFSTVPTTTPVKCYLSHGTITAGNAVRFERVRDLEPVIGDNRITVAFLLSDIGFEAGDRFQNAFGSTQPAASFETPAGGSSATPHVSDAMGPWDGMLCDPIVVAVPPPAEPTVQAKESPGPGFAGLAVLPLLAWIRRRA